MGWDFHWNSLVVKKWGERGTGKKENELIMYKL
jgi:hypothetical protein